MRYHYMYEPCKECTSAVAADPVQLPGLRCAAEVALRISHVYQNRLQLDPGCHNEEVFQNTQGPSTVTPQDPDVGTSERWHIRISRGSQQQKRGNRMFQQQRCPLHEQASGAEGQVAGSTGSSQYGDSRLSSRARETRPLVALGPWQPHGQTASLLCGLSLSQSCSQPSGRKKTGSTCALADSKSLSGRSL